MIDNRISPQVMCAACGHVFPHPIVPAEASVLSEVSCPACETQAKPKGIMKPSGFPSLETFERNWKKSKSVDSPSSKTLTKSSETC